MKDSFKNAALNMQAIRAIEESPSMRIMRELHESPTLRAIAQFENSPLMQAISQFEESPAIRLMRDLEDSSALRYIKELEESPAFNTIQQLQDSPLFNTIQQLQDSPLFNTIQQLHDSPLFNAVQQLQDSPALRIIQSLETSPAMEAFSRIAEQINHSYGALTFSEAFRFLTEEYVQQSDLESLNEFSVEIQKRANNAPLGVLSAEFYLNLIFALFLFYWSQMSALESKEKMLERMSDLEQTITIQLSELNSKEEDKLFLAADRTINLRSGPGIAYDVIGSISRNQKLIELERYRDWAKVEYFNHIENANIVGWAHSRYLLTITSDTK